jgi:catechol 2,3-dioxygenase-like lactoylglutathione lyase family enzyme
MDRWDVQLYRQLSINDGPPTKEDDPMAHNTFHVALYVHDLDAAIARYRKLVGREPAKVRHDYAKFELSDPPVILSLNTGGEPGTVSHLGIRYPSTGDVASEMVRTKHEGIELLEQKGTTCCYAKADKFWVRDADGIPWEMYTLIEDAEAETATDVSLRRFLDQDMASPAGTRG